MLGKTHMVVGAATALAVLQPSTVSGCLCAAAGGVIGGWICDIDVRNYSAGGEDGDGESEEELVAHSDERWQVFVFVLIIAAICFVADYFAGDGMCAYITSHLGIPMIVAVALFVIVCAYGIISAHRTVMHSILGGIVLSSCVNVLCAPLAPAFALGYASHVGLDLFNKRRLQLLWPLEVGIKFGVCGSNGVANRVIGVVGLIACLVLFPFFLVSSLGENENFASLFQSAGNPSVILQDFGISNLLLYLVAINIITFLVYLIDFLAWKRGAYGGDPGADRQDFVHTVFLILPAAGGALGMLLAVVIGTRGKLARGKNGNIGFYTHGLCFLVVWICIYIITCNPFGIVVEAHSAIQPLRERHILFISFAILNALAFVVFLIDGNRYRKKNLKEIGEFILAFFGGATGAYLAMVLSGHKMNTAVFGQGVPLMMAMHYVLLAAGYCNGFI